MNKVNIYESLVNTIIKVKRVKLFVLNFDLLRDYVEFRKAKLTLYGKELG